MVASYWYAPPAIGGRKDINGPFVMPQTDSPGGQNLFFDNEYTGFVLREKFRLDPEAYLGSLDWSSPGWRDVE